MTELLTLRNKIDACDNALLETLKQRFDVVHDIGRLKDKNFYAGRPIREAEQLARWVTEYPKIPFVTLQAIFRTLVGSALNLEIKDFCIHVAKGLETIAMQHYNVTPLIYYSDAEQLFSAQHHKTQISIIPLDDSDYWQNEIIGKQLYIIEALPYESTKKQAVILANLPCEFIPYNHLFLCDNFEKIPQDLEISIFCKIAGKVIYQMPSQQAWQNLSGLAITYLGGYSDAVTRAINAE